MKLLDGRELAGYIKERQAKQVRALRQAHKILPKLAIIVASENKVIDSYVNLKKIYGEDILVAVDVYNISQGEVRGLINQLNGDEFIHGIIVQLPLPDQAMIDEIVNTIVPEKDVDGLGVGAKYISATATAINWLLTGYNIELFGKRIAVVGQGRLVGRPLSKLWLKDGFDVAVYDDQTEDLTASLKQAEIIVSATGVPGLITSPMVSPGAVVVDAGTASEGGVIVGDVSPDIRRREDLTITPEKGGVGPLTVAALFDNVISAARASKIANN